MTIKNTDMNYYRIKNLEQYFKHYRKSVKKPELFWENIASNFTWHKTWDNVFTADWQNAEFKWFEGARLNITENCLDRHLADKANKTAIIFEPNDPTQKAESITYADLHRRVCKMANVLLGKGVRKGDRVCLYLPMVPDLAVAVLACARIGAVHSVVFAGFSASALSTRINDAGCKIVITADGGFRGNKTVALKEIVDHALQTCPGVESVLLVKRTEDPINMQVGRDEWIAPLLQEASEQNQAVAMDAEDPLFILYTSGSTGKPKGMLHTTAGYMVYTAYTFANIFDHREGDIFWCTADIGWITGHSYILYGPLLNGSTTVLFEGIPTYPDQGRFWETIDRHGVTQFYTAPTAIRSLAKESTDWVSKANLSSLRIIGSVGEPINEEAWHWYNDHVGRRRCPIVDTWWQTETGGIMISPIPFVTPTKPTFATLPMPGVLPVLIDDRGQEITGNAVAGKLCISSVWPGIARTIWGDHNRYRETYFTAFPGMYFTGDGALRDETGYYRITGRVDDVIIVSGHNLGTAPIEDAINEHPAVAESAIVGYPHELKGNALYGFIILKDTGAGRDRTNLQNEINQHIADHIGPIAKLDKMQFVSGLPKTRSGKIMRRILRKIAEGETGGFGDTSTLLDPDIVSEILRGKI